MKTDATKKNVRLIDQNAEYETLRQEILDSITARDNYIISMYTIIAAMLCVAFELGQHRTSATIRIIQ